MNQKKGFYFGGRIFGIYLKNGRKRVLLSILYGSIIFLLLTGLSMIVYVHRYQTFNQYQSEKVDWLNDGLISVFTNEDRITKRPLTDTLMDDHVNEFSTLVENNIPGIKIDNYSAAIGAEVYIYTYNPLEPWLNQEFLAGQKCEIRLLDRIWNWFFKQYDMLKTN